jgi:hypothetical protein
MLCPLCKVAQLRKAEDGALDCPRCGLRRRATDKVWLNEKTNFHILNRNIKRSPPGTKVEIVICNPGLSGICGTSKEFGPTYGLRSEAGYMLSFSRDKDDLILLIAECNLCIEDAEVAQIVDGIKHDHSSRNAS